MVPAVPSTVTICGMQACGGVAGGDDGEDSVFAGHEGGVRGEGAAVGDDGGCSGEQRRPCRSGGFRDKHIAVAETAEVLRAMHDAYWSGCAARRCGVPDDDVLADFTLTAGFLRGAADHISDQPNRLPRASRARRGCVGAATGGGAPAPGERSAHSSQPEERGDFLAVAEEHIICLFDRTGGDHVFA